MEIGDKQYDLDYHIACGDIINLIDLKLYFLHLLSLQMV